MHCAIAYEAGLGSSFIGEIAWQGVAQNRGGTGGRLYTFQSKSPPLLVLLKNKDRDGRPF